VATDHEEIAKVAKKSGVDVAMTDSDLPSGSDRVWAAVKDTSCDVVINVQGDEPLIIAEPLDQLCQAFEDKTVSMATLARPFQSEEEFLSPHIAKIVLNKKMDALYFSRLPIPHTRDNPKEVGYACVKHIGLYGYTKEFLKAFCQTPPCAMENAEALEQLRALWMGYTVRVILTNFESWGVDRPEDVLKVEELLSRRKKD
jgi:3-deoxy-manno-octulosonate cytidylyltransferase (CMP-KDO synthetase)